MYKEFMIKLINELKSKNSTIEVDKKQIISDVLTDTIFLKLINNLNFSKDPAHQTYNLKIIK